MATEFCPQCGKSRIGSFRYCRNCGFDFEATSTPSPSGSEGEPAHDRLRGMSGLSDEEERLVIAGRKIDAIKAYRSRTHASLVEAKAAIDACALVLLSREPAAQPSLAGASPRGGRGEDRRVATQRVGVGRRFASSKALVVAAVVVVALVGLIMLNGSRNHGPGGQVVGFGAADADWDAHHIVDPAGAPGALYNPDSAIGMPRYQAVGHDLGHVDGYVMRFPGMSLEKARAEAMAELPADATILWTNEQATCAQMEVRSATLGTVLAPLGDQAGEVHIYLDTVDDATGDASLDPSNINEAVFGLGSWPTAEVAPRC
jgi:hypothetical protein